MTREDEIVALLTDIRNSLRAAVPPKQASIDVSTTAFNPNREFRLYVGKAGVVKGLDAEGAVVNRYFTAGYHPFPMTKVDTVGNGTTATDMAAMYFSL